MEFWYLSIYGLCVCVYSLRVGYLLWNQKAEISDRKKIAFHHLTSRENINDTPNSKRIYINNHPTNQEKHILL